jgi:hypothetical protein
VKVMLGVVHVRGCSRKANVDMISKGEVDMDWMDQCLFFSTPCLQKSQ